MNVRHFGALAALMFLAGCGGGSAPASNIVNLPNLSRIGTWKGRVADGAMGVSGTMTITIAADRAISGSWTTDAGDIWTLAGNTAADELIVFPHDESVAIDLNAPNHPLLHEHGDVSVNSTGHLTGSLQATTGNPPVSVSRLSLDIVRQ